MVRCESVTLRESSSPSANRNPAAGTTRDHRPLLRRPRSLLRPHLPGLGVEHVAPRRRDRAAHPPRTRLRTSASRDQRRRRIGRHRHPSVAARAQRLPRHRTRHLTGRPTRCRTSSPTPTCSPRFAGCCPCCDREESCSVPCGTTSASIAVQRARIRTAPGGVAASSTGSARTGCGAAHCDATIVIEEKRADDRREVVRTRAAYPDWPLAQIWLYVPSWRKEPWPWN